MRPATFAAAVGGMLHHRAATRCPASGWQVSPACADHGRVICPLCTTEVAARPDPAHPGALKIRGHR